MTRWEERLCFRSTNRVVRPFEWGLDWAAQWPGTDRLPRNGHDPEAWLQELNTLALDRSDEFFSYLVPDDFRLEDGFVRFTSPVHTPYEANNTVHGQWFPARNAKAAVIVL